MSGASSDGKTVCCPTLSRPSVMNQGSDGCSLGRGPRARANQSHRRRRDRTVGRGGERGEHDGVPGAGLGRDGGSGRRVLGEPLRLGLDALRAIPDFAWALALIVVLGPGPLTGALATALSVTGILGRAFGQLLESVAPARVPGIERLASSPFVAVTYGRLPRVAPAAWSYGLAPGVFDP